MKLIGVDVGGTFTDLIAYRLEISYDTGGDTPHVHAVADAYRFLPTLGEIDLHLFAEGRHERLWEILGAHPRSFTTADGVVEGVSFAVWAPNAKGVTLIGEFNHWDGTEAQMRALGSTGVWELFWPGFPVGGLYKFKVHGADGVVTDINGKVELLVGESYQVQNNDNDWVAADTDQTARINSVIDGLTTLRTAEESQQILDILAPYKEEMESFKQDTLGQVSELMPFERIPAPFNTGETPTGSYAAYVVADAFLKYLPKADVAIQNAGGVRATWWRPVNVELCAATIAFIAEHRTEFAFREHGYLWLHGPDRWDQAVAHVAMQNAFDRRVELLSPAAVGRRWPVIDRVDDLAGATFSPLDGLSTQHDRAVVHCCLCRC